MFLFSPVGISQNQETKGADVLQTNLKQHVTFLASDNLEGRKIGSTGFAAAMKYSEDLFKRAGLKPLFADQNRDDGYRQPVTIIERNYTSPGIMAINHGDRRTEFSADLFKYFNLKNDSLFLKNAALVYLDYGIYEPAAGWDELASLDLKGKIAIVKAGAPMNTGNGSLPDSLLAKNESVDGTFNRLELLAKMDKGPEGIILITNDKFEPLWPRIRSALSRPIYIPGVKLANRISLFPVDLILVKPEIGSALLELAPNSPLIGQNQEGHQEFRLLDQTIITMEVPHSDTVYHSWNLGGFFPGSDPKLKNDFIVVGAHIDHLGVVNNEIMNGADDNASGCAAVYELARMFKDVPHNRSLAFIIWTGEECEALGSQQFMTQLPIPAGNIKGYVNFDMIGRVAPENAAKGSIYLSADKPWLEEVKLLVTQAGNEKDSLEVDFTTKGLSDHSVFSANGIFSFGFYSGHHADNHKPTDDIEKIDFIRMRKIVTFSNRMILNLLNR